MTEAGCAPEALLTIDWETWDDVYLAGLGPQAPAEIERVERALLSFFARFTMRELYEQALQRRLLLAPVADARTIMEDPQLQARQFFAAYNTSKRSIVLNLR